MHFLTICRQIHLIGLEMPLETGVVAIQHTINPNLFLIDFTHPDVQDMIVNRTIALSKCGLYDGVFFDWWSETRRCTRRQ